MTIETILIISLVALIAGALGFFISRTKAATAKATLEQQNTEYQQQAQEAQKQLGQKEEVLRLATTDLQSRQTELAVAQQQIAAAGQHYEELNQSYCAMKAQAEERQDTLSEKQQALSAVEARLSSEQKRENERVEKMQQLENELKQERGKTSSVEAERSTLNEELATLRTTLEKEQKHADEKLKQLEENKQILKQEFENLANEIFETKGKSFTEQNKASLDALLNPFKQQINEFKGKVEHLQLEGTKQQVEMRTDLKQLQGMHQQMTQEAHNLATALQGQKKVQGNWGELVLENVLDRSGLQLGTDYKREVSFNNDDGGRSRPDVVVYLPQNKHLIIDAKVSLNAYTRYINTEDEVERKQALKEHVDAFAARIKELADRDYYKLSGLNSPEMVFMFVPIESAFVEALKADESLFQKAIEQNVLVATPTTLLTSLNIVRQLWRFEDQNKHTAELARKAEGVFKKLKTFLTSFEGVKKGLERAQDSYAKAESQLVSGPGNLVKQVNEFKKLAPAIKEQLPDHFTEKADLELTSQLEVVESDIQTEDATVESA